LFIQGDFSVGCTLIVKKGHCVGERNSLIIANIGYHITVHHNLNFLMALTCSRNLVSKSLQEKFEDT